jgi:hypothetical protein
MNDQLIYLLCGTLGVLLQICLKIKSLKTRANAANMQFVFSKYLQDDWPTILGSLVSVALFILFIPNILAIKPGSENYLRIMFAFVGYTGSSLVQLLFSATNKKILNVIDLKTNIADNVEPPVTEKNKDAVTEVIKGDTTNK